MEREKRVKKAAFHTLGCKVNIYETEAMQRKLTEAGYTLCSFEEQADVYVINTCSVTNIADRKSRQMLHRARSLNPEAVIVATGCYAQGAGEELIKDGTVDIVLGNHEKREIASVLAHRMSGAGTAGNAAAGITEVGNIAEVKEYDDIASDGDASDHTRAFLKIQDGCNQFCSYCIIPYMRGRIRSRRSESILEEAKRLAARGFRELVLTGIHLSSYGRDLPEETPVRDLGAVIRLLDMVSGIDRIRVGSLEPKIITEPFVKMLSERKHFCPHFHLSLQSGSDTVLKRMNRHYTAEEYLHGVEIIRKYFPDAAITTDVIVGFPGETEEEFEETMRFAERVGFYEMHIFPYSKREGTRAASMPGQLSKAEKAVRAKRLSELGDRMSEEFRRVRSGRTEEVLLEEEVEINGERWLVGCTKEYVKAAVKAEKAETNHLVLGTVGDVLSGDVMEMKEVLRIS